MQTRYPETSHWRDAGRLSTNVAHDERRIGNKAGIREERMPLKQGVDTVRVRNTCLFMEERK
jgi:hypothetical protein